MIAVLRGCFCLPLLIVVANCQMPCDGDTCRRFDETIHIVEMLKEKLPTIVQLQRDVFVLQNWVRDLVVKTDEIDKNNSKNVPRTIKPGHEHPGLQLKIVEILAEIESIKEKLKVEEKWREEMTLKMNKMERHLSTDSSKGNLGKDSNRSKNVKKTEKIELENFIKETISQEIAKRIQTFSVTKFDDKTDNLRGLLQKKFKLKTKASGKMTGTFHSRFFKRIDLVNSSHKPDGSLKN